MMEKNEGKLITLFTIGFTKKSARTFFELLQNNEIKRIIDIRLNNVSQLAGFTKKEDFEYFLGTIQNADYKHLPIFAPSDDILSAYKKKQITWKEYEEKYKKLISERQVEKYITLDELDGSCLLCSEDKPDFCHRRLLAEYFKTKWESIVVKHL